MRAERNAKINGRIRGEGHETISCVAVVRRRRAATASVSACAPIPATPRPGDLGELKWDGASGCYFVIDRKQDMFFMLLEQTPSERQKIQPAVKRLIYEAMEN